VKFFYIHFSYKWVTNNCILSTTNNQIGAQYFGLYVEMSDIGKTQNSAEGTLVQTTGKNERFHIALLCLFARQSSTSRTKVTSRAKFSARLCLCTCSCRPRCCRLYCRYTVSGARKTSKHSL